MFTIFARADKQRLALESDHRSVPRPHVDLVRRVGSQITQNQLGLIRAVNRHVDEPAALATSGRPPADVEALDVAPMTADVPRHLDRGGGLRYDGQQLDDRHTAG